MIALFLPGDSPLHRAPAGAKLAALALVGLGASFLPRQPVPLSAALLAALTLAVIVGYAVAAFRPGVLLRRLWATRWIVLVMALTQLIFLTPWDAVVNTVRVVDVILLATLLTLTTATSELLDVLVGLFGPLRRVGVDPQRIGLTLSLAIAMLPVIAGLAARVRDAQRARGVRLGVRAVVPLLVLSLRHADGVADALTARGVE